MPHVTIDRDGCISCGTCWLECPDVFAENPADARSEIVERYRGETGVGEGDTPDELADCVQVAADACPVVVITVS